SFQVSRQTGIRTILAVPLVSEVQVLGSITIRRLVVRRFTAAEIAALESFADQAAIAIGHARLFHDVTEALEQQPATAEILRVISASPTDLQPVMDTVVENAARLCGARDASIFRLEGNVLRFVAKHGALPSPVDVGETVVATRDYVSGRAVVERRTIHIEDLQALPETEFPEVRARQRRSPDVRTRTFLATPLLREGMPVGALMVRRAEARPFSARQIELLETFAAQAVTALQSG